MVSNSLPDRATLRDVQSPEQLQSLNDSNLQRLAVNELVTADGEFFNAFEHLSRAFCASEAKRSEKNHITTILESLVSIYHPYSEVNELKELVPRQETADLIASLSGIVNALRYHETDQDRALKNFQEAVSRRTLAHRLVAVVSKKKGKGSLVSLRATLAKPWKSLAANEQGEDPDMPYATPWYKLRTGTNKALKRRDNPIDSVFDEVHRPKDKPKGSHGGVEPEEMDIPETVADAFALSHNLRLAFVTNLPSS